MKALKVFDIEVFNLSEKKHVYDFDLDDKFFSCFENSPVSKGKVKAIVELDKSSRVIMATFKTEGFVELTCDRSLEVFDFKVSTENQIVFKYGETYEELSEDVIMIPHDFQTLNVAQYLYEFIGLIIPMKKLHPRFAAEEALEDGEEGTLIYSTGKETDAQDEDQVIDPRWEALNKLKKKD